ncbi:MFS transporter [Brevibacillus nitrificans]|uniref:MFS transporter n=1 Tax=Brevibacillus nitrificans TaxID=651560 RepID=UPI00285CEF1E|nr:MFS transporter [Brevibacillus nitrificans]MDR7316946.1 sugar phosphate permease [Brevibacillus nitrificans]
MLSKNMRWVYISLPIFFFWFFGQIDKLGISVIQTDPGFLQDMGLTGADKNAKIGFLTFIFTVAYALSNLFWGVVIDKLGARKTAMLGIAVWTVTMVMAGLSTSYEMFVLSRIILGIGEGIMIPVSGKFIANWFNRNELGRAQASWISGNYLGPALGALVLSVLIANLTWHSSFFILAACNLILNIPMFYFMTRDKPEDHPKLSKEELAFIRSNDGNMEEKQNFAQDFRYWIVWIGMLVASFLFFGLSIWLPTYLTQGKGFAREAMAGITSLSWLFALVFVLVCGYLADKTKRPGLLAAILFGLCALFLGIAVSATNPIIAGISIGLAMGTQGGVFHLSNLFIVKFSTPETAGRAAGLMGFTNILGGFASYIMGWMRDLSGGDFGPSILMLIAISLIGFVAYLFTLKREAAEAVQIKQAERARAVS